ncbi:MAG: DUF4286 family protein [Candidatus Kapabacteria bacterium]|nr:DUF4286 family protein [Candidatus Kapabacteria bacterium]
MIIYQVDCTVPNDVETEWREWMMNEHISDVMNTEMFESFTMHRVVKPVLENHTVYSIQYATDSIGNYERYRLDFAPVLQQAHKAKFGDAITAERCVMETIGNG